MLSCQLVKFASDSVVTVRSSFAKPSSCGSDSNVCSSFERSLCKNKGEVIDRTGGHYSRAQAQV